MGRERLSSVHVLRMRVSIHGCSNSIARRIARKVIIRHILGSIGHRGVGVNCIRVRGRVFVRALARERARAAVAAVVGVRVELAGAGLLVDLHALLLLLVGVLVPRDVEVHGQHARQLGHDEGGHGEVERVAVRVCEHLFAVHLLLVRRRLRCDAADKQDDADQCAKPCNTYIG